jgi:Tfp pilus assembly protein PilO
MANLLVPIALLISSVGLFFTYISPAYDTLKAFQDQNTRLDATLAKFDEVIEAKEKLTREYVSIAQVDLDNLNLIIPNDIDAVQTIIILDNLAQTNNISVDSFTIPNESEMSSARKESDSGESVTYSTATFQAVLLGSYENMKRFLYQIERSLSIMDTAEFQVGTDKESGLFKFTVVLTTYWQPK